MSEIRIESALWLLAASAGMIVMSSAFIFLYGAVGLGCAVGWHEIGLWGSNMLTVVLAGLWLVHLAALGALQWYAWGLFHRAAGPDASAARLLAGATCLIAAIGLVSTAFIGFPVLILPPCA